MNKGMFEKIAGAAYVNEMDKIAINIHEVSGSPEATAERILISDTHPRASVAGMLGLGTGSLAAGLSLSHNIDTTGKIRLGRYGKIGAGAMAASALGSIIYDKYIRPKKLQNYLDDKGVTYNNKNEIKELLVADRRSFEKSFNGDNSDNTRLAKIVQASNRNRFIHG